MSIQLYPSIAKAKRNGAWQNLPGFVQQSGDADIEAMLANKETSTTAQYPHAKDSFFILNDILYQADADIPVNGAIAVGTNCHVSTLGYEVSELINKTDSQTEQIQEVDNDVKGVTELYGINLFNPKQLLTATGWTESDGEYSGTIGNLYNKFGLYKTGLVIDGGFKENTQYSIRLKFKTSNSPVSSGNTIQVRVYYTDGTDTGVIYFQVTTDFLTKSIATASGKTISKIGLEYSNSYSANNTMTIKDIQIAEGATQPTYEPYQHTAIDLMARANNSNIITNLFGALKNTEKIMNIKWKRGIVNANGNVSSDATSKGCVTTIPSSATRLSIVENYYIIVICFRGTTYLGKININGELDSVTGNWKQFSGDVNLSEIFTKYNADRIAFAVVGSGSSDLITDADAIAFGESKCTVYTQEYADYNFVPKYFEAEIDTAVANAKSDMGACGKDGFSFIFTTDNHWNHNDGHSPAIIKALQKATNIQDVVLGGDLIDGSTDKAHELELLQHTASKFVSPDYRLHYIFGNHDSNTVGQTTTPAIHLSQGEVFMATQHPQKYTTIYSDDGYVDYYWDDDTTKTRVIVVDSKIEGVALTSAQLAWFNTTLASTPSGYRIIVMMHIWYGVSAIAEQGQAIFDAVDDWNSEHDTKVVAMFGGHLHADAEHTTTNGVPLIITTCDIPTTTLFENIDGQVIDIITVNYSAKKINCRRVGRGTDREVSWA